MRLLALSFLTIILTASTVNAQFAGGSGTVDDPYQIETVVQLQEIRNHTDKHFIQIADIDASDTKNWNEGKGFDPIGDDSTKFTGSYDGSGYKISNLTINRRISLENESYVGLFGYAKGSELKSISLEDVSIEGSLLVGGIAGKFEGNMSDSYSFGTVIGDSAVGGLVGSIGDYYSDGVNSYITNSYSNGTVSGNGAGGLVGTNYSGLISNSFAGNQVNGLFVIGGLVGLNSPLGEIVQSYSTGNVGDASASTLAGGVAGSNFGNISDSYSTGNVFGNRKLGGFVGRNRNQGVIIKSFTSGDVISNSNKDTGGFAGIDGGVISQSYWDAEVSGQAEGIGSRTPTYQRIIITSNNDLLGLTTDQMTGVNAYENMTALDFGETWVSIPEDYPRLLWSIAYYQLSNITSNAPITEGQALTIDLTVKNIGGKTGSQPVVLKNELGDIIASSANLVLETGQEQSITLQWQTGEGDEGEYTFTIASEFDQQTIQFNVRVLPAKVELTKPESQQVNVPIMPLFEWKEAELADSYQLQISDENNFEEPLFNFDNLESESYQMTQPLDYLTDYYWRVRGRSDIGDGDWSDTLSFTIIIEKPDIVALASPDSGSVDISITPDLQWQESDRAEYYRIILATDAAFEAMVEDTTGIEANSFSPKTLNYNTDYFWKVKAINVGGESEWSPTWSFFTEYALDTPDLVSPEDQADELPLAVTFFWQPVEDAKNYELQVARDGNFENLLDIGQPEGLAKQVNTNKEAQAQDWNISQKVESLDYSTQYFWRVRATGDEGISDWSQARSLTTEDAPITDPVVLSYPADESTDVAFPVTLEWEAFDDADHYDIQISESSEFLLFIGKNEHDATSFITSDLKDTTTYFWRVQATVDEQKSDWSEVWTFTTELRDPDIPVWEPQDGQSDVELTPLLVWGASERAVMYDLQLSDDPGFSNLIIDESELPDTEYQVTGELEKGVRYYWKVRAGNQSGYSEWSDVLSFVTVAPTSVEQDELPISYELQQNYPNPFNPSTQIRFALPEQSHVRLTVYNMLGQQVATLVNETRPAGWHDVTFDASGLSSGVFIYRLEADGYVQTKQMLYVK